MRLLTVTLARASVWLALTGLCAHAQAQRTATATAVVTNGVVAAVTVTDGGSGYPSAPTVMLGGSGGSGANAIAVITSGAVSSIQVLNGGGGFTNAPGVGIAPPDVPAITLNLLPGSRVAVTGPLGSTLELQAANSLNASGPWSSLASVQLTNCPWVFSDSLKPTAGQRFYRAVQRSVERPAAPQDFIWLPAGSFTIGTPLSDPAYLACEGPQTQVRLTQGYFLCQHEVTEEEYGRVTGANPSYFVGETNLPVESVSWAEATNYCALLTAQEHAVGRLPAGWLYRLPTEAEWEYGCRAETVTVFGDGDDEFGAQFGQSAWFADTASQMPAPVGRLQPNAWGLLDMSGNVAEWCWDVFGDYAGGQLVDPTGPSIGQYHVARGGSWNDPAERCRSTARASYSTVGTPYRSPQIGFRVALGPVYAQGQPVVQSAPLGGTITGQVTMRSGGAPVPGVEVTLVNTNFVPSTNDLQFNRQGLVQVAVTDLDGKYSFSNVKPGDYAVVPMHSDANSTYQLGLADSSEPAVLAVTNDTHQVSFNLNSVSLNEAVGKATLYVEVLNWPRARYNIQITFKRRERVFFDTTMREERAYRMNPYDNNVLSHETSYGCYMFLAATDNYWELSFVEVYPAGSTNDLGTAVISFPLDGCPSHSRFAWDFNTRILTRTQ